MPKDEQRLRIFVPDKDKDGVSQPDYGSPPLEKNASFPAPSKSDYPVASPDLNQGWPSLDFSKYNVQEWDQYQVDLGCFIKPRRERSRALTLYMPIIAIDSEFVRIEGKNVNGDATKARQGKAMPKCQAVFQFGISDTGHVTPTAIDLVQISRVPLSRDVFQG